MGDIENLKDMPLSDLDRLHEEVLLSELAARDFRLHIEDERYRRYYKATVLLEAE